MTPEQTGHALLEDQSLVLVSSEDCRSLVLPWLPINRAEVTDQLSGRATIIVEPSRSSTRTDPLGEAALRVGSAAAYVDDQAATAELRGTTGSWGRLDLERLEGSLEIDLGAPDQAAGDVYAMLTIASALFLGRQRRALIHAGAFIGPRGDGWLVVGDARSGKSTTCVSLAMTGLGLLSDDQVVLIPRDDTIVVEGWLRPLHLDVGWSDAVPRGERRTVHPLELGNPSKARSATLAGAIFTSVVPNQVTAVDAISAAEAFTSIVRQSPWLLADRHAAESVVELLSTVSLLPGYALRLGLDTFGKPERLRKVVEGVIS